jgi:hypothetical protein
VSAQLCPSYPKLMTEGYATEVIEEVNIPCVKRRSIF